MEAIQSHLPLFLPRLLNVRFFDGSIGTEYGLPFKIPPSEKAKGFELHYSGIRIVCSSGIIFNEAPDWSYMMRAESEEWDWNDSGSSEREDSDSDSDSDDKSIHSDDSIESQLGHESTLQIFDDGSEWMIKIWHRRKTQTVLRPSLSRL
ncbi:hypothetical protein AX16_003981 [Volvariella volvacea WC 439]|nr:hypothetical protein AX16_003981 [Volvariella volvacea WC 439]